MDRGPRGSAGCTRKPRTGNPFRAAWGRDPSQVTESGQTRGTTARSFLRARPRPHNRAMSYEPRGDRSFFLANGSDGRAPRLVEEDEEHLRRVLRVRVGDRITGLDGRGLRIELEVLEVGRRTLVLAPVGPEQREPAPGEPGAPLDWIEVAAPLPRGDRGEELVDRLVQLGVAAFAPLAAERSQRGRNELDEKRRGRLERIAREACKQSRRAWGLELGAETSLESWLRARERRVLWFAQPAAPETLLEAAGRLAALPRGSSAQPVALAIGAIEVALGPHVQRIETAAETAAAIVAQVRWALSR
jgi:16S rRNA (uracil1498-N3)-methyltransferase